LANTLSDNVTGKTFLKSKLAIAGLIIYETALFIPWVVEESLFNSSSYFWSFMVDLNWLWIRGSPIRFSFYHDWFYFLDFWSVNLGQSKQYLTSIFEPFGLYVGWFFLFVLQISTLILYLLLLIRSNIQGRHILVWCVVLFPIISLLIGAYQCIIQSEIRYHSTNGIYAYPFFGFWLASAAVLLLSVSYFRSIKRTSLTRRNLMKTMLIILLASSLVFFFTNELEFQTKVTKLMDVWKTVVGTESSGSIENWTVNFARIMAVAKVFRARLVRNIPNYYACELEVPVISYRILLEIYSFMGYHAREPIFMHIMTVT
jgi:hypothetical protein